MVTGSARPNPFQIEIGQIRRQTLQVIPSSTSRWPSNRLRPVMGLQLFVVLLGRVVGILILDRGLSRGKCRCVTCRRSSAAVVCRMSVRAPIVPLVWHIGLRASLCPWQLHSSALILLDVVNVNVVVIAFNFQQHHRSVGLVEFATLGGKSSRVNTAQSLLLSPLI